MTPEREAEIAAACDEADERELLLRALEENYRRQRADRLWARLIEEA